MLGAQLITKQTGPEGKPCNTVLLTERVYMRRELYLSILMDRASGGPVIVASSKGGTSIEDIAAATPELIVTAPVDIVEGLTDDTVDKVVSSLGFRAGDEDGVRVLPTMRSLASPRCYSPRLTSIVMFRQRTCSATCTSCSSTPMPPWSRSTRSPRRRTATVRRELAVGGWSVAPVSLTTCIPVGRFPPVLVCDAKLNFDDNAAFRQADLFARRDFSQEDQREVEASKEDLNYIGLDGTIGCMGMYGCCCGGASPATLTRLVCSQRRWAGNGHHGYH